jgi:regulatory protein
VSGPGVRARTTGERGPKATRVDRVGAARERRELRAAVDDPEVVLDAAAALLAIRPRTVAELGRRLRGAGYRDALVGSVLVRLQELGYLDDAAFARAWVESRDRSRPRGERALRAELSRKGVPDALVRSVLEERAGGADGTAGEAHSPATSADAVAARRLLERRRDALLREPDERRRRQRAYALLARSGFDPDTAREAVVAFSAEGASAPTPAGR